MTKFLAIFAFLRQYSTQMKCFLKFPAEKSRRRKLIDPNAVNQSCKENYSRILSPDGINPLRAWNLVFDVFKSMWVFGYGSLIWKADFPFKIKLVGYIKGYKRRFYQHSVDHRGRPHKPGRVVTLIPSHPDDSVWGVAYEIYKRDESFVTAHLDYREKTGYKKHKVTFYPTQIIQTNRSEDGDSLSDYKNLKLEPFDLTIYIGTEDNQWFAGPASIEEMAKQIFESEGPSGTNKEYLYNLAKAMRTMAPHVKDDHLFGLEKAVRDLERASIAKGTD